MNIPDGLLYTKEHEWIKADGDTGTIGITDYAQHALGDVTFVELPKTGEIIKQSRVMATVESVKAASDIYAPLSGEVTAINTELTDNPGAINQDCYQKGWIARVRISNNDEKQKLMSPAAYTTYLEGLA